MSTSINRQCFAGHGVLVRSVPFKPQGGRCRLNTKSLKNRDSQRLLPIDPHLAIFLEFPTLRSHMPAYPHERPSHLVSKQTCPLMDMKTGSKTAVGRCITWQAPCCYKYPCTSLALAVCLRIQTTIVSLWLYRSWSSVDMVLTNDCFRRGNRLNSAKSPPLWLLQSRRLVLALHTYGL